MAKSIKIADHEMEIVRREAELSSRSIASQVTHWMRIGRSIERSPQFSYAHVREALEGRRSADALTGEEQEVFIDDLMAAAAGPTEEQEAFFAERRKAGLGVGTDDEGKIVKQSAKR